jgi:polar amino acid transport system substrate-binding protein
VIRTLTAGTFVIQSAYPDPPFDVMKDGAATGFDIELMRAVCDRLGLALRPVVYAGDDFNGIFEGLAQHTCDAVISGTTITPERAKIVRFSKPYLVFNQGIAVNRRLTPHVATPTDLRGLTAGIQKGNTSDFVARRLLAQGDIAAIRYYPYHGIEMALDDFEAGNIGLVIKLFPVISWLVPPGARSRDAGADAGTSRDRLRHRPRRSLRRRRRRDPGATRDRRVRAAAGALARL